MNGIDIRQNKYVRMLLKRKLLIIGTVAIVTGLGSAITFSQTPLYEASTSIIIESTTPQVLGSQVSAVVDTAPKDFWSKKDYMSTQIGILTSMRVLENVVKKLNLHKNQRFRTVKTKPGEKPPLPDIKLAAGHLQRIINAKVQQNSDILQISIRHSDPALASQVANTLASTFIEQNLDYRLSSTTGAVTWLTGQLDDLKKQLDNAEQALYKFSKENNLVALSQEDRQAVAAKSIQKINDALIDARLTHMGLAAKQKQLQGLLSNWDKDPFNMSWDEVMENPTIRKLKETVIDEQRKLVALQELYGEKYPLILNQKSTLEEGKKYLAREVKNVLSVQQMQYKSILEHERLLTGALQEAKRIAQENLKLEVEYQRLKRSRENVSALYQFVLKRLKESGLTAQLRVNNIRPLDAAVVPLAPVYPRVWLNLMVSFLLGFVMGIGLALLVDAMDNSIKTQEDLNEIKEIVFLGAIPNMGRNEGLTAAAKMEGVELLVHRKMHSDVAEACRAIRTNILFTAADRSLKTFLITSPGPREGKTSSAVSLAIVMAQAGNRVLLIDTDMRRPRLHRIFGVAGQEGLTSLLRGDDRAIDDLIRATEVPNLFLLPCGLIPPNPAELCQSEMFKKLRDELSRRFDRLVFDTPPVMLVTDAVVLSTLVDGTVLVARMGETSRDSLRETTRHILDVNSKLLGCVLNDVSADSGRYYSKNKYYRRYGRKYRYYQEETDEGSA